MCSWCKLIYAKVPFVKTRLTLKNKITFYEWFTFPAYHFFNYFAEYLEELFIDLAFRTHYEPLSSEMVRKSFLSSLMRGFLFRTVRRFTVLGIHVRPFFRLFACPSSNIRLFTQNWFIISLFWFSVCTLLPGHRCWKLMVPMTNSFGRVLVRHALSQWTCGILWSTLSPELNDGSF